MRMRLRLKVVARLLAGVGAAVVAAALVVVVLALLEQATPRHSVAQAKPADPCARSASIEVGDSAAGPMVTDDAQVTICAREVVRTIPASFLGISTEYWTMPLFEAHGALLARVLSLLRVPDDGPLILRVGGTSAQHTFWLPSAHRVPGWVFALTPRWFAQTRVLVDRTAARLILDLNTITGTPADAARLAGVAERLLPRGSIIGFEVGNESDLYERRYWLGTIEHRLADAPVAPPAITSVDYAEEFPQYSRALREIAPTVPLLGPAVGNSLFSANWIRTLLARPHPDLGTVSGHWYPYSACARRGFPSYPTVDKLLSQNAAARMARGIAPVVALVHRRGLRFRLTELNSVTCGGLPGVSNRFATALWTPDALFALLGAGVDGINVHVREDAINGAFALRQFGLLARPLLYGLLLFDRTLGQHAQLVRVRLHAPRALHLDVWAVRLPHDVLHVLVIDKSSHPAHLDLVLPATGDATVQRLLAPSASARSGVTLDGQRLGVDARWHGRPAEETITPGDDGYELAVPRFSAALVTVRLARYGF